jgi:hypothetical protein
MESKGAENRSELSEGFPSMLNAMKTSMVEVNPSI